MPLKKHDIRIMTSKQCIVDCSGLGKKLKHGLRGHATQNPGVTHMLHTPPTQWRSSLVKGPYRSDTTGTTKSFLQIILGTVVSLKPGETVTMTFLTCSICIFFKHESAKHNKIAVSLQNTPIMQHHLRRYY